METYESMRIGFYICLGIAVLFLVLSVLFFFKFDIPGILSSRRGKKKEKTINAMEEKDAPDTIGDPDKQKAAVTKDAVTTPDRLSDSGKTERFDDAEAVTRPANASPKAEAPGSDGMKTAVPDGVTRRYGESGTAVPSASIPAAENVRFEITKKVIVCDTEEIAG